MTKRLKTILELSAKSSLEKIYRHHSSEGHPHQADRAHYMLGKRNVLKNHTNEKDKKLIAKGYDNFANDAKRKYKTEEIISENIKIINDNGIHAVHFNDEFIGNIHKKSNPSRWASFSKHDNHKGKLGQKLYGTKTEAVNSLIARHKDVKGIKEVFVGGLDFNINGGNPTQSRKIPVKKPRKKPVFEAEFKEDAGGPTNAMGVSASNPNSGNIQGFSPLLGAKKKKFSFSSFMTNKRQKRINVLLTHSRQQRQGQA